MAFIRFFIFLLLNQTSLDLTMAFKYQSDIDEMKLAIDCPIDVFQPSENMQVFRFSYEPIEHEHNFLPNILIDKIKNIPFDYHRCTQERKCLRCGTSFFLSQESALKKWNKLSIQFKENYGYTHIATGELNPDDGFMNKPKNDHFTFYENDNSNLTEVFNLSYKL